MERPGSTTQAVHAPMAAARLQYNTNRICCTATECNDDKPGACMLSGYPSCTHLPLPCKASNSYLARM